MDCNYMPTDCSDLMIEWVNHGDNQDNPYMKFLAYWVAFNMYYSKYSVRDRDNHILELPSILNCYKQNTKSFDNYDPIETGDANRFFSKDLYKVYGSDAKAIDNMRDKIRNGDTESLLRAVYRVRCNFFHGNKGLGNPTDKRLVEDGARIIRGYLGTLDFVIWQNHAKRG